MCLRMKCLMKQFEVYIANLDPAQGIEIEKTRPVIIVSPNEMNLYLKTVIIAPLTSQFHENIPTRIEIILQGKVSYIVLDQLRTLDKSRLHKFVGNSPKQVNSNIKNVLLEMFA